MSNVVNIVDERLAYCASRTSAAGNLTPLDEQHFIEGMVSQFQLMPEISLENATAAVTRVMGATFLTGPTKAVLRDMIDYKVSRVASTACVCAPKLKFQKCEQYQSKHCWDIYGDMSIGDGTKLHCMAQHMGSLGMKPQSLDETALAEAASLALHTTARMDAEYSLNATRQLKLFLGQMTEQLENDAGCASTNGIPNRY